MYAAASISLFAGAGISLYNMLIWSSLQYTIAYGNSDKATTVLGFFAAQGLAGVLIVVGFITLYSALRRGGATHEVMSVRMVLSDAFAYRHALLIAASAAIAYGVAYSFFSSLIVYQPTVDFRQVYGVTSASWDYVTCCGAAGTVPKLILYLSPSTHLAFQLVPLSLLFLLVIPVLVGFNAMFSFFAFARASSPLTGRWMAASGAVVGLFTACPTCAGLFLASSIGGIGTTLAVVLAPFQVLFIGVSIPVLLLSPLFTAISLKRSYEANCRLPAGNSTPRTL